jgi:hypothetical protein
LAFGEQLPYLKLCHAIKTESSNARIFGWKMGSNKRLWGFYTIIGFVLVILFLLLLFATRTNIDSKLMESGFNAGKATSVAPAREH